MSETVIPMPSSPGEQPRLSVYINPWCADGLRDYQAKHATSITETVRRFIGVAQIVLKALDDGDEILIRHPDQQTERLVFDLTVRE